MSQEAFGGRLFALREDEQVATAASRFRPLRDRLSIEATWPRERALASVRVGDGAAWRHVDDVGFAAGGVRAVVRCHGVVEITATDAVRVTVEGRFVPAYRGHKRGHWLLRDETGGLGVHPLASRRARGSRFTDDGFELTYALRAGEQLWISAYPSRRPDPRRAGVRVAHEGRPTPFPEGAYPSDALIADAGRHCDVFALHAYFWKAAPPDVRPRFGRYAGRRCSWLTDRHEPELPEAFARVAASVQRAGMDLVVYLSPLYSRAADLRAEVRRVLAEYPVRGLYLDGVAKDLPTLLERVRMIRAELGPDRLLYLNATDEPLGSVRVSTPFVDAYADIVLRGDAGRGGLDRERFLRWAVSGRGTSEAASLWCHYASSGRIAPRERVPPDDDVRAAKRAGVGLWRRSLWERGGGELARFDAVNRDGPPAASAAEGPSVPTSG